MAATCTKQDLQREVKRLSEWTTDKYTGHQPGNIYRDFPEYQLSSKAKKHFQSWIDTPTASCQIMGAESEFWEVTHAVYVMMDRFWKDLDRVAFFCRGAGYFAAETRTQSRGRGAGGEGDKVVVGREVGALALIYSVITQLIEALPPAEKFGAFTLHHLREIDGTKATAQVAFDTITHLLERMDKKKTLAILINEIDALYSDYTNSTAKHGDVGDDGNDEESRNLVIQLLAVLAASPSPLKLWITYRTPGESVYREAGYAKGEHFAVKLHFPGRKHGLDSLDFSAGTELSDRRFRAVRAVSTSPDAVAS